MKKRILSTIIALNVLITSLSGCLSNNKNTSNELINGNNLEETTEEPEKSEVEETVEISNYANVSLNVEDKAILEEYFNTDFSNVLDNIASIDTEYLYSELYRGKYDIDIVDVTSDEVVLIQNNTVDYDTLYNRVLDNNRRYMEQYNINNYKNTSNALVAQVCQLMTEQINEMLKNNKTIDRELLNQKLSDLKIFSYVSYSYGFYNQENGVLAINEDTLNNKGADIINDVIGHEIVHLVQSASSKELDRASYLERFGYCYKTSEDTFNPYNWTWFTEACAESYSYRNYDLAEPFVYETEIKTLETMKLATFNGNNRLEESLYSADINSIYAFFGAETEEEKAELQKMFYAFTINYNDMPGQEGINFYNAIYTSATADKYSDIKEEIKGSACLTLSKIFYKNLARNITGVDVKVADVFKVIAIYELEMSRQLWYQSKYDNLETFLEGYVAIQDLFFQDLATSLGVDLKYIKGLYYAYNNEVEITEVNIPWLSSEQNSYLEYINESRVGNKKDAILKVYEDNYENSVNKLR